MWSRIANLKDNITAIAADVLETQEEIEAETNGDFLSQTDPPRSSNYASTARKSRDIQWYKEEVDRLQSIEKDMEMTFKSSNDSLRKKEEEMVVLRRQNEELRRQVELGRHGGHSTSGTDEIVSLKEQVKALQAELSRTIENHQEKVAAVQDSHRRRTDVIFEKHKREIESLQKESKLRNGMADSHQSAGAGSHPSGSLVDQRKLEELEEKLKRALEKEKTHERQVAEKDQAYGKLKNYLESSLAEINDLKGQLEKEREALSDANLQLERDHGAVEAAMRECNLLKAERQRMVAEMAEVNKSADERSSFMTEAKEHFERALAEHSTRIAQLQAEKDTLQQELKESLEAIDKLKTSVAEAKSTNFSRTEEEYGALKIQADANAEELKRGAARLMEMEEMLEQQKSQLGTEIEAAKKDKDKAVRDLMRLKQHLLDIESAESEKMDRDTERIRNLDEQLRTWKEKGAAMEAALGRAESAAVEANLRAEYALANNSEELQQLRTEVASCHAALQAKDVELNNLQIALGQYYAESEANERLRGDLASAKEALSRLGEDLRISKALVTTKEEDMEKVQNRAASIEQRMTESQQKTQKLQEEVSMLRRALEQSMIRINRMSTDSDFYVDRRIVIKLLVTYFQRNHSREVLDLMSRMLGFSEEEKQRVGLAQQAGAGGVVKGVLGFSGRLVGGLLRGVAQEAESALPPDENMTFGDLWIDFLLKESEERERREKADQARKQQLTNPTPASPRTPRAPIVSSSSASQFFSNASPRSPSKPYTLTPRTPPSPVRSPSLSVVPDVYNSREDSRRETLSNGFLSGNSSPAVSPISAADASYMSGGDFSPVPLNSTTPTPSAGPSPYSLSQSRSLPYSL